MADEEEKDNMIQCTKELKFYKAHGGEQVFDGTVFNACLFYCVLLKGGLVNVC